MESRIGRQLDRTRLPVDVEHRREPDIQGGVLCPGLRIQAELQVNWVPRLLSVFRESAENAAAVEELQEFFIDPAVVTIIKVARYHITTMSHIESAGRPRPSSFAAVSA